MRESETLGELIARLRGPRSVASVARLANMSATNWTNIENGQRTEADSLWRILSALDAPTPERKDAFALAGFSELYDGLKQIGARQGPEIPGSAELGIAGDETLRRADREDLLRQVARLRYIYELEAARGLQAADADETREAGP